MKKTTIYFLIGILAITISCKEEADQKKVPKEVMVTDSGYDPEAALAKMGIELKTPTAPAAPDYAEANREGIFADIETLPTRRLIEAAARQGTMVEYEDPRTGEMRTADFRGFGDIDLTKAEMSGLIDLVPQLTQAQLDNLVEFGPQFVTAQREQMQQLDLYTGFMILKN